MKIIDISWPMSTTMTQYKDAKHVVMQSLSKPSSDAVEHSISLHSHTGTHIDAPLHFIKGGSSIDEIPLMHFIGPCRVLDLSAVESCITEQDLAPYAFQSEEIILFKTKNSQLSADAPFKYDFVYLDKTGAEHLVKCGIKTIGIDYLGIERNQPDHETHKILLGNKVALIEGLRLEQVQAGSYILMCLPLLLVGLDAAPARAVLLHM